MDKVSTKKLNSEQWKYTNSSYDNNIPIITRYRCVTRNINKVFKLLPINTIGTN